MRPMPMKPEPLLMSRMTGSVELRYRTSKSAGQKERDLRASRLGATAHGR